MYLPYITASMHTLSCLDSSALHALDVLNMSPLCLLSSITPASCPPGAYITSALITTVCVPTTAKRSNLRRQVSCQRKALAE